MPSNYSNEVASLICYYQLGITYLLPIYHYIYQHTSTLSPLPVPPLFFFCLISSPFPLIPFYSLLPPIRFFPLSFLSLHLFLSFFLFLSLSLSLFISCPPSFPVPFSLTLFTYVLTFASFLLSFLSTLFSLILPLHRVLSFSFSCHLFLPFPSLLFSHHPLSIFLFFSFFNSRPRGHLLTLRQALPITPNS